MTNLDEVVVTFKRWYFGCVVIDKVVCMHG